MKVLKQIILFGAGGLLYVLCELMWRGYSHWTMFLVGGICFIMIGLINEVLPLDMTLVRQMAIGAVIITTVEFVSGCIINLWIGWNVWDYSGLPFNILGQVCLPFSFLWFLISAIGIVLDDYLRYWWFGEERPHYTFWRSDK